MRRTWQQWLEEAKKGRSEDDCWVVPTTPSGQRRSAQYTKGGPNLSLYRISYLEFVGEISSGLLVCHSCHNGCCVNPRHLFLGTQKDNMHSSSISGWPNGRPAIKLRRRGRPKLTDKQVKEIRRRYKAGGASQKSLAAEYHVSQGTISDVITRVGYKRVT